MLSRAPAIISSFLRPSAAPTTCPSATLDISSSASKLHLACTNHSVRLTRKREIKPITRFWHRTLVALEKVQQKRTYRTSLSGHRKTPPFFDRLPLYFSLSLTSRVSNVASRLYPQRANTFYDGISHKKHE